MNFSHQHDRHAQAEDLLVAKRISYRRDHQEKANEHSVRILAKEAKIEENKLMFCPSNNQKMKEIYNAHFSYSSGYSETLEE